MAKKITNKDYIAIDGMTVNVGGRYAEKYHGKKIKNSYDAYELFLAPDLKDVLEVRIMQSDTRGEKLKAGNPNPSDKGSFVWVQIASEQGVSPWIFCADYGKSRKVASFCAIRTMQQIMRSKKLRDCLLNAAKEDGTIAKVVHSRYSYNCPDAYYLLQGVGKISLNYESLTAYDNDGFMTLYIDQKRKNMSKSTREEHIDMAEEGLKHCGFKQIYDLRHEEDGLAFADIQIEYDINKKPYTITNADIKEIESVRDLIRYVGVKTKIHRMYVDPKSGKDVLEQVPNAEFERAIMNYIRQNQK